MTGPLGIGIDCDRMPPEALHADGSPGALVATACTVHCCASSDVPMQAHKTTAARLLMAPMLTAHGADANRAWRGS
jgi:hypothetical protein